MYSLAIENLDMRKYNFDIFLKFRNFILLKCFYFKLHDIIQNFMVKGISVTNQTLFKPCYFLVLQIFRENNYIFDLDHLRKFENLKTYLAHKIFNK